MDDLQFQKAEFIGGGPKCTSCQAAIDREYFHLAGQVICPACAERVRSGQQSPPAAAVLRGLAYGAGMAIACCIGYAIIRFSGFDWALIAVGVGFLVGRAVRTGSSGLGGLRMQIISVLLTYLAIALSYTPLMVREAGSESPLWIAVPVMAIFSLAIPIIEPFTDPVSGIIGLIIVAVGLRQAWTLAARDERALMGPYQREDGAAASA